VDLGGIALYSVILGKRIKGLVTLDDVPLVRRLALYLFCVVLGLGGYCLVLWFVCWVGGVVPSVVVRLLRLS
jgi:hypothetical protein